MKSIYEVVFASVLIMAMVLPVVLLQDDNKDLKVLGLKKTNEQLLERKKRFFSPYQRLRDAQIKKANEQNKAKYMKIVQRIRKKTAEFKKSEAKKQEKLQKELKTLKDKCPDMKRERRTVPLPNTTNVTPTALPVPVVSHENSTKNSITVLTTPTPHSQNGSGDSEHARQEEIKDLTKSITKLNTMRAKEKLLQEMKNQRADIEARTLKIKAQEIRAEISLAEEDCKPKVRVKRSKGKKRKLPRGFVDYNAKLKDLKKVHEISRKMASSTTQKLKQKVEEFRKKCVLITLRARRFIPPPKDNSIGNYTSEKSKIAKTLAKLKETRNEENNKQIDREQMQKSEIDMYQGLVDTLEKKLKEIKLKCGNQGGKSEGHAPKIKRAEIPTGTNIQDPNSNYTKKKSEIQKTEKKEYKLPKKSSFSKIKKFFRSIAKKFKCVKEGKKCKYGYKTCCGKNLYCNPLLTKSSKTGICTPCVAQGESCLAHDSCCSKRCIKTKANGKCGPSNKDKKEAKKKSKAKSKKKEKEKKKIESALTKAAKEERKKG